MATNKEASILVVLDSSRIKCVEMTPPTRPPMPSVSIEFSSEWYPFKHDLMRQINLHIHRFNFAEITPHTLRNEADRILNKLILLRKEVPEDLRNPVSSPVELSRTKLDVVDPSIAHILHRSYHYLGTPRGESLHLGLYAKDTNNRNIRLMSVATLSRFDLMHLVEALPRSITTEQVLVLSRLFTFDWSPQNTASYTLGRVFNWLQAELPHIKLLLTYLDPNLGFKGTVYKATNWMLLGREKKARYLYLDSEYVTARQMIRLYGTADLVKLKVKLGNRITASIRPLQPLEIYGYFVDPDLRKEGANISVKDFSPDTTLVGATQ